MVEGGQEGPQDDFAGLLDTVDLITSQQRWINQQVKQSDLETRTGQPMR